MSEPRNSTTPKKVGKPVDNTEAAMLDVVVAIQPPEEIGGRGGLDPTRYGDWEKNGRCIDF
jgi:hypothetical protein